MKLEEYTKSLLSLGETASGLVIEAIGDAIRQSIKKGTPWKGVDYRNFATLLLKIGILRSHRSRETKKKNSSYNAPSWKETAAEISKMLESTPELAALIGTVVPTENDVAQFATWGAIEKGPNSTDCVSLAFYVWFLLEQKFFEGSFFENYFSQEERAAPDLIRRALISHHPNGSVSDPTATATVTSDAGSGKKRWGGSGVSVYFSLKDEHLVSFDDYFRRFSFGPDSALHAVVYRPRLSKPGYLMKTFLAIKARKRQGDLRSTYSFTHIYKPPSTTRTDRIAIGKVAPLDDGVYFLGGQRPKLNDYTSETDTQPYKSAKILALRWEELMQHELLLPAVTISTNATGKIVASRAAVRITPLDHSDKLELREVACSDLLENLRDDLTREAKAIAEAVAAPEGLAAGWNRQNQEHFMKATNEKDVVDTYHRILTMTNNSPGHPGRDAVPPDFIGLDGEPLKPSVLSQRIEDALAEHPGPYEQGSQTFDLWTHLRFAPLKLE